MNYDSVLSCFHNRINGVFLMNFSLLLQLIRASIGSPEHDKNIFKKLESMDKIVLDAFNALTLEQRHELFYDLVSTIPDNYNFNHILDRLVNTLGFYYFEKVAALGKTPKNQLDLLDVFPNRVGLLKPPVEIFSSAIDNAIGRAPLPASMQALDPDTHLELLNASIKVIEKLIHFKVDVRNICGKIDCEPLGINRPFLLKTTLHFAMDVGLNRAVERLVEAEAYKNLHSWAPSALEYAIWLNRLDYVEILADFDPKYVHKTLYQPSTLQSDVTLIKLCESNPALMKVLHSYDPDLITTIAPSLTVDPTITFTSKRLSTPQFSQFTETKTHENDSNGSTQPEALDSNEKPNTEIKISSPRQ